MTRLFVKEAVKVLFALEWAATHSSVSRASSCSQSLHLSLCLPVKVKKRRTEKQTLGLGG